jgi:hypothetical protein
MKILDIELSEENSELWPGKGDKLFDDNVDYHDITAIIWPLFPFDENGWYNYAFGYEISTKLLLDCIVDEGNQSHFKDSLIYPLLFNFFHYLELALKTIIINHSGLLPNPGEVTIQENHEIKVLWKDARKIIEFESCF